jgi:hypothetical protein
VRTVLGLSKTSTSIGWVLVDGQDAAAEPLDHDAFDITDASTAAPAATARRVRDIATASGFTVDAVHVTSSGNVASLRDALSDCGFTDVVGVPLSEAVRCWGRDTGYALAMEKTAICVFGQDSAALSIVETRSGAITSTTTTVTSDIATFTSWLNFALGADGSQPDVLYLIGSRAKLDDVAGALDRALSLPVVATHEAQIALARGAASSDGRCTHVSEICRSGLSVPVRALAVVSAVAVVSFVSLSAAASSLPLPQSSAAQPVGPAADRVERPPADVPVAPVMFPPPQPPVAPPAPDPLPAPAAAVPYAVAPEPLQAAIPEPPPEAAPVEHIPEPSPVEHLPEGHGPVAPGPVVPGPSDPGVGTSGDLP